MQESILNGLPRIKPWEYGLGDKGYVGCPQIITEWKGDGLTRRQIEFNLTLQHYRGRVEHLISEMVQSRRALNTRWHGSFSLLAAVMKITAHMVGLQERMKASAVRCVWPVASVPPPHSRVVPVSVLPLFLLRWSSVVRAARSQGCWINVRTVLERFVLTPPLERC